MRGIPSPEGKEPAVGALEKMLGQVQEFKDKFPCVVEKEHPAVSAEEGEAFEDCYGQSEKGVGNDHGSGDDLGPSGPMEASGLEKCVVEPHVNDDHKSSKSSHEVKT